MTLAHLLISQLKDPAQYHARNGIKQEGPHGARGRATLFDASAQKDAHLKR